MERKFVLLSAFFCFCVLGFNPASYNSSYVLNPAPNDYTIYWTVENNQINIALVVNTQGWVGFGIAEPTSGGMAGSDILTLYFADSGVLSYDDRYTFSETLPVVDQCNNWILNSGQQTSDGHSVFELTRALDTGDPQDRPIVPGENRIIWAFGSTNVLSYHGYINRNAQSFVFYGAPPQPQADPGSFVASYQVNNYMIPLQDTTYTCNVFALPVQTNPLHLIEFDAQISSSLVHHAVIQGCISNSSWVTSHLNNSQQCYTTSDQIPQECSQVLWAWTPGMGSFSLPTQAGFRVSMSGFQYVVIQTHYTNPEAVNDVDTSIYSFTLTPVIRPFDAGVMQFGDPYVSAVSIPPLTPLAQYEFSCSVACTSTWPWNITVFGDFLHMHQLGTRMYSTHWQGSNYVGYLNDVDFYNYEFQQTTIMNKVIQVGDRINTHCIYNTSDVTTPTPFGLASSSEMCIEFVFYYPKIPNMDVCGARKNRTNGQTYYSVCGAYYSRNNTIFENNPTVIDGLYLITFGVAAQCQAVLPVISVGAIVGVCLFAIVIIVGMNVGLLFIALKSKEPQRHIKLADQENVEHH